LSWRRTVICLGLSQLVCWGITYYLIGALGELMVADLGWSRSLVYGGFSASLLVMGLSSPLIGRLIDHYGGRQVMVAGSGLIALGCVWLALAHELWSYYAAWTLLGLAMRCTLYDAAFAALARIGGPGARRPISQITLLGGLASTVFWPIGHALSLHFGWRGAVFAYAGFALLTVPLHLAIPGARYGDQPAGEAPPRPHLAQSRPDHLLAGGLYALIVTLINVLNSGMSAHMIGLLSGLGLTASVAVWVASLRGIGQSAARLCEVVFGGRLHPLSLNLLAASTLPVCFIAGLWSGQAVAAAIAFALLYGASNGIMTITRGTLPLVLFDHRTYGTLVGRLLVPSFLLSAVSPLAYALVIEHLGNAGALGLSILIALTTLVAALALKLRFG
jgi:predicted MFS family arabinose efflux permease